jgi:hypothetical protein
MSSHPRLALALAIFAVFIYGLVLPLELGGFL